jgi:hypothetical protein
VEEPSTASKAEVELADFGRRTLLVSLGGL